MEVLSRARTSTTDSLRITEAPAGAGLLGLTLCPGKRGASVFGPGWERGLDADVRAVRNWGAAAVVTLIEDNEFRLLQVERLSDAVREARPGAVETPEQATRVLGLKASSPIPDGAGNEVA